MKCNLGKIDRIIRVLVAIGLGVVGYLTGLWWLYLIVLIPLVEVILGYCPLYNWLKINTCKAKKKKK